MILLRMFILETSSHFSMSLLQCADGQTGHFFPKNKLLCQNTSLLSIFPILYLLISYFMAVETKQFIFIFITAALVCE